MASPESRSPSSSWVTIFRRPAIPFLVVLCSFLLRPTLELYNFHAQDRGKSLTKYANSSLLNHEHCTVNYAADACEDVNIHFVSSTAFLTCGNPAERVHWYPPSGAHNAAARNEESFQEHLFKYNIKKKKATKLKLEGLAGDFITHGVDIYSFPDDPKKVWPMLVSRSILLNSFVIS